LGSPVRTQTQGNPWATHPPVKATPTPKPKARKPSTPKPVVEKPAPPDENAKPKPPAEPKATPEPKPKSTPEPKPKASPEPKATPKPKTTPGSKTASTPGADAETTEREKFAEAKRKAIEDPAVVELKNKADNAAEGDEAHKALRAYNKALFNKMRKIDPSIKERIDGTESAVMKRLGE
jgi:hypothetical protein